MTSIGVSNLPNLKELYMVRFIYRTVSPTHLIAQSTNMERDIDMQGMVLKAYMYS